MLICFKSECLVGWIHEENNEACGAILFILTTDIFTNKSILKEVFWFIIPEKRKSPITYRLIKKAEEMSLYLKLNIENRFRIFDKNQKNH